MQLAPSVSPFLLSRILAFAHASAHLPSSKDEQQNITSRTRRLIMKAIWVYDSQNIIYII